MNVKLLVRELEPMLKRLNDYEFDPENSDYLDSIPCKIHRQLIKIFNEALVLAGIPNALAYNLVWFLACLNRLYSYSNLLKMTQQSGYSRSLPRSLQYSLIHQTETHYTHEQNNARAFTNMILPQIEKMED
jgi:hypothetical protein